MPSLGLIIGLPIVGVALIASTVAFIVFGRYAKRCAEIDGVPAITLKWGSVVAAVAVLVIAAIGYWPYRWEYHSWQQTTGTVQAISKRLVSKGDKSMEERYVVQFTDGRQRACDDSRCTMLRPGMALKLRCKRAYQWGATSGYDCNYVDAP